MIAYMILIEYFWVFQEKKCVVGTLLHALLSGRLLARLHEVVKVFLDCIECFNPCKGTTVCLSIYLPFFAH